MSTGKLSTSNDRNSQNYTEKYHRTRNRTIARDYRRLTSGDCHTLTMIKYYLQLLLFVADDFPILPMLPVVTKTKYYSCQINKEIIKIINTTEYTTFMNSLACVAGVKSGGRGKGRKTRDWGLGRERDRLQ